MSLTSVSSGPAYPTDRTVKPAGARRDGGAIEFTASLALMIVAWQAAAFLATSRLFPGPAEVLAVAVREAVEGPLLASLAVTLARVAACFMASLALGVAIGLALGRMRGLDRWVAPWLTVLLNLPALVLVILAYVWLGLVDGALIVAVALTKVPVVAVSIREGARALDESLFDVARVYRFGFWGTLRSIVLPQLAPYLLAASRTGLALIWKIVLVAELIGRSNGVGFELQVHFQNFDVPRLLAYSMAFIGCVLLIERSIIVPLERRATAWRA